MFSIYNTLGYFSRMASGVPIMMINRIESTFKVRKNLVRSENLYFYYIKESL